MRTQLHIFQHTNILAKRVLIEPGSFVQLVVKRYI